MADTKHSIKITLGSGVFDIEVLCHDRIGICGAQWPRKELAALRVLDGASAGRADDERKAMAQQRDEACRERNRYKRDANAARRERNKVRKELARAIAPWTDEEVARPCESGNWGAPSLNERIMRERGFRDE